MIATIIIVGLAFIYLGYESDWMRVRLLIGEAIELSACCEWRLQDTQVTKDMKQELFDRAWGKVGNAWGYFKEYHPPLCGWGFAYQFRDFQPEYKVELITEHSKQTMRTQSIPILRDAFRVYRNPYVKVKLA